MKTSTKYHLDSICPSDFPKLLSKKILVFLRMRPTDPKTHLRRQSRRQSQPSKLRAALVHSQLSTQYPKLSCCFPELLGTAPSLMQTPAKTLSQPEIKNQLSENNNGRKPIQSIGEPTWAH